jgi:multicomponent Na+:H+ antiporter subunit D
VHGALNFAITNSVGAFLVLSGIALLYGRTGALNLAQLGQSLAAGPADRLVVVAFLLLMVGLFVKAAVVPFHFWLADAYALAPTAAGVLFAGVSRSSACTRSPGSTGRSSPDPWPTCAAFAVSSCSEP